MGASKPTAPEWLRFMLEEQGGVGVATACALMRMGCVVSGLKNVWHLELQRPGDGMTRYTLERDGHAVLRGKGKGDFLRLLSVFEDGWREARYDVGVTMFGRVEEA